jgi:hypothetical protein
MQGKRRSSATLALCHIYGMLAGCRVTGGTRLAGAPQRCLESDRGMLNIVVIFHSNCLTRLACPRGTIRDAHQATFATDDEV